MIKEAIVKIVSKQDLSYEEAYEVMNEIMDGKTTATQKRRFFSRPFHKKAPEPKLPMRLPAALPL